MGYLVTHIAACLVFAQLLGLLLGWLLWGYLARQRAIEVQSLRERIADMQILTPRMAFAGQHPASISASPGAVLTGPLAGSDLPLPFKEASKPLPRASSVQDELAEEVKEARLQHYEKQVRELESMRDRLPLLQADLSNAITSRRSAEKKLEETRSDFEVRISNLLGQVRDFERAAQEWDRMRDEFERSDMVKERELSTVKSHLRDLQNNQLPQKAEGPALAGVSVLEHADLRERYQKALKERDAIAAQFESWKQSGSAQNDSSARLAESEEALRNKDEHLAEQLSQVETLLWRVAELEPFAASAPRMEDDLRRQESEIAGHVAMHAESSDHIRSLLNRLAEQESESSGRTNELQKMVAECEAHIEQRDTRIVEIQTDLDRLTEQHSAQKAIQTQSADEIQSLLNRLAEHESESNGRTNELQQMVAARETHIEQRNARIVELQTDLDRLTEQHSAQKAMQAQSADEILSLLNRLAEQESESRGRTNDLQQMVAAREAHIEQRDARMAELQRELDRLTDEHTAHAAMQAESSDQIRSLSNRLAEQESESSGRTHELQRMVAAREAHIDQRDARMTELQAELNRRVSELAEHREALVTARRDHSSAISDLEARLSIFQAESRRALDLEKQLVDRSSEIRGFSAAYSDLQSELLSWKSRTAELEPLAAKAMELEKELSGHALEIRQLREKHSQQDARLADLRQRLVELEPLAARLPEAEQKLALQEERHQADRSQLKVNSAMRIRRLRQSITTFKG